ncbi:hypothetical protein HK407_12g18340 [Ordospora pajunii]|uniref:uncharacterized protein n=1 Tax=Ordospora pajunii TaxID=3039483 RepID=UPI0029527077|nr:uncharacterized protein HK407_12g18340 [Ordospora pajunii]KAH9410702.1 hypothetical protein HK407_12g18340 [Ordospora pajunii]
MRFDCKRNAKSKHMHRKSTIKRVFKVFFLFIQGMLLTSGIGMLIVSTTVYIKSYKLLGITKSILMLLYAFGMLKILSAVFGYMALSSKKRVRVFAYVCVTLVLMNIQAIGVAKSVVIYERSGEWGSKRWGLMDESQRGLIQSKFRCCGFGDADDRAGEECRDGIGCMHMIQRVAKKISVVVQKIIMFSFLFESVGIGILSMLMIRR